MYLLPTVCIFICLQFAYPVPQWRITILLHRCFLPSKGLRTAVTPRETAVLSAPNHGSCDVAGVPGDGSSYALHLARKCGKPNAISFIDHPL